MKRIAKYILLLVVSGQWSVAGGQSVFSSGQWWKMSATTAGVYRVTPSDIPALAGASVDSLAVYGRGGSMLSNDNGLTSIGDMQPIGIDIRDRNGNRRFDADDEILFYGESAGGWRYEVVGRDIAEKFEV